MLNYIVIGNMISFIGAGLMVLIGFLKDQKKILAAQDLQFAIMGVSNLILGGISGVISNLLSIARNVLFQKTGKLSMKTKVLFILLQALLTAYFNKSGAIGWLPVIAAAAFTFVMDSEDPTVLKISIIFGQALWAVFDITFSNYVSCFFDILTILTNLYGIFLVLKTRDNVIANA